MDLRSEIEALKLRRRSVRPEEMHALLTRAGFRRRQGRGDHWVYSHRTRLYPLTIDPRRPLLPAYVTKAVRAIEEVLNDEGG